MGTGAELALLGLVGGLLTLDRTAFVQVMASRPLVGSTVVGYLLGNPEVGLTCGLLLELFWLMDLPVGASVPPDEVLAGVLAAAFAVAAPATWSLEARAALGVMLALPFGYLGRLVDSGVRRWNGGLLEAARERLAAGRSPGLTGAQALGAARFFLAGAGATALGGAAGLWAVGAVARHLPPGLTAALELTEAVLPVLGCGAVLAGLRSRRAAALFGGGALAGLLLGQIGGREPADLERSWRP